MNRRPGVATTLAAAAALLIAAETAQAESFFSKVGRFFTREPAPLTEEQIAQRRMEYEIDVGTARIPLDNEMTRRTTFLGSTDVGNYLVKTLDLMWWDEAVLQDATVQGFVKNPNRKFTHLEIMQIWDKYYAPNPDLRAAFGNRLDNIYGMMAGWDYSTGVPPFGPGNSVVFMEPYFELVEVRADPDSLDEWLKNPKKDVATIPSEALHGYELRGPYWRQIPESDQAAITAGVRKYVLENPKYAPKELVLREVTTAPEVEVTPAAQDMTWTIANTPSFVAEAPAPRPETEVTPVAPVTWGEIKSVYRVPPTPSRIVFAGVHTRKYEDELLGTATFTMPLSWRSTRMVFGAGMHDNEVIGTVGVEQKLFGIGTQPLTAPLYHDWSRLELAAIANAQYINGEAGFSGGLVFSALMPGFRLGIGGGYDLQKEGAFMVITGESATKDPGYWATMTQKK